MRWDEVKRPHRYFMHIIDLPFKVKKPMLACGADMKGAFALAKGNKAYLVDGFGDLSDADNLKVYESAIIRHEKKLGIQPHIIACDLHPDYNSSRFAEQHAIKLKIAGPCRIQHHEAHIASGIVENSIKGDVIGVAFDGTGYGLDSCVWGGEFFIGNLKSLRRAAHFEYMPMPGGAAAITEPWRMAVSYLLRAYGDDLPKQGLDIINKVGRKRLSLVEKMIVGNINSPLTSSAGRLFDAVGSLIMAKEIASFEAEIPVHMESIAAIGCDEGYQFDIVHKDGAAIIEVAKLIKGIVKDLCGNKDKGVISAKFHNAIAEIIADVASGLKRTARTRKVVLSGGVFQNKYLTKKATRILKKRGFVVYSNSGINTNDSGVPIGQLAIANARKSCV